MALVLTLVMVCSIIPAGAFASESAGVSQVDESKVTIEGTNGFGNLLSAAVSEEQENAAEAESEGYTVTDLAFEGNVATVTYDALEEAILIVALYSEDGMQMLASGKATVSPDATEATVTIEGTMPQYFQASAYLVDGYDFSPLCEAYDTPMYTRDMQELLASTIHDYDPERVLNLDEDETTNFAVYAQDTKVIDQVEGRNIVASVDDETASYVIQNADEQFTNLAEGDIFVYPYGENDMLIVKVASIQVEGTTVTITGAELEMEEAFCAVKIEGDSDTNDMVVDESSIGEGLVYEGILQNRDPNQAVPMDNQGGVDISKSVTFRLDKYLAGNDDSALSVKVSGSLKFSVDVSLDYYVTLSRQYLEFRVEKAITAALTATGKAQFEQPLCEAAFFPIPCINIAIEPTFKIEISGEIEFSASLKDTSGYIFESKKGAKALASNTKPEFDVKAEATIFIGFDLKPQVELFKGAVAEFTVEMPVGLEVKITRTGTNGAEPGAQDESFHNCDRCLDFEPFLKVEIGIKLQFLKLEKFTYERTLRSIKLALSHYYYSLDTGKKGVGFCPNWSYRLTVSAMDSDANVFEGAVISVNGQQQTTNSRGNATFFLPRAVHSVTCDFGDSTLTKKVALDRAKKLTFTEGETPPPENSLDEELNFGTEDDSLILAYGECGSDATWIIYGSGRMIISGNGAVTSKGWGEYMNYITVLEVDNGITSICENAFSGATNLRKLVLADSVATLGLNAFKGCNGLVDVTMPCDLTITTKWADTSHESSFTGCTGVRNIHYTVGRTGIMPNRLDTSYYDAEHHEFTLEWKCRGSLQTIIFDEGITHIADYAFISCTNLTEAQIPSTVDSFGHYCFSGCKSLKNIQWPEEIVFLGNGAFRSCETFTAIDLPDTVTTIPENAFSGCTSLTALEIPNSVTTLGLNAFKGCTGLKEVTMPCDLTITTKWADTSYESSFTGCTGVRKIHYTVGCSGIMPNRLDTSYYDAEHHEFTLEWKCRGSLQTVIFDEGITHIADYAFFDCIGLTEVVIPSTVNSFGHYAFSGCKSLSNIAWPEEIVFLGAGAFRNCETFTEINLPDGLVTIYENTFSGCKGLTSLTIPNSVTTLGLNAFNGCIGLKEVMMPCDLTITAKWADTNYESSFTGCNNVRTIHYTYGRTGMMPNRLGTSYYDEECYQFTLEWKSRDRLGTVIIDEGITQIGDYAFYGASRLKTVTLPASLDTVGDYSFANCSALTKLTFSGDMPFFCNNSFKGDVLTIYYPDNNDTWTDSDMVNYGGTINWVAYTLGADGAMIVNTGDGAVVVEPTAEDLPEEEESGISVMQTGLEAPDRDIGEEKDVLNPDAIYGGEYSTEITDTYTLKTASFKGLLPGGEYLLLALKQTDAVDPLAADNLLYVDQGQATEDGTLVFTYVPRETVNVSYVIACGPSTKNLKDAVITIPEMTADGQVQAVNPLVVYDGKTLTEGEDYVLSGQVSFTEAGTYTCVIEGIRNYTGTQECTYTVQPGAPEEPDTPEVPEVTAKIISYSTSLGGNIAMNFYVELSEDLVADPDAYIQFTFAGQTKKVPLCDGVPSGTSYRFACPITSKNMTDEITAQVYNADGPVGDPKTMAVDTYCNWIIANTSDQKTINLMKAMLNSICADAP